MQKDLYMNIPTVIKKELEIICQGDSYGLSPRTLFYNIYHSSGTYEKLAELFEVPIKLIIQIKEISESV